MRVDLVDEYHPSALKVGIMFATGSSINVRSYLAVVNVCEA